MSKLKLNEILDTTVERIKKFFQEHKITKSKFDGAYKDFSETRKLWDLFWYINDSDYNNFTIESAYHCNDKHIESLMKKAYSLV